MHVLQIRSPNMSASLLDDASKQGMSVKEEYIQIWMLLHEFIRHALQQHVKVGNALGQVWHIGFTKGIWSIHRWDIKDEDISGAKVVKLEDRQIHMSVASFKALTHS